MYFSLQYGGQCYCGNEFSTSRNYIKRPDSECGGANGVGGFWRNSIYRTCDTIIANHPRKKIHITNRQHRFKQSFI